MYNEDQTLWGGSRRSRSQNRVSAMTTISSAKLRLVMYSPLMLMPSQFPVQELEDILRSSEQLNKMLNKRSPLSEYFFLPWLGATLRGLFLRQAPTAGALLYTMAVINGNINPLFLTSFSFLFLLEARLWLEIARLVRARWERRQHAIMSRDSEYEVQTLWSNEDVQSIEVHNYVY